MHIEIDQKSPTIFLGAKSMPLAAKACSMANTDYDAIVQPEPRSMTADADNGQIWRRLSDGTLLLERNQVIVQRMKSK